MGKIIKRRLFKPVYDKKGILYTMEGDMPEPPPLLFIDEVENCVYELYMDTPTEVYYIRRDPDAALSRDMQGHPKYLPGSN